MNLSKKERADHRRLVGQVRMHHPELLSEWTRLNPLERVQARFHLEKYGAPVPQNAAFASIGPLTIRQLNLFSHKVAVGLYFEHFREVLPNEGRVSALWRSKEDFAKKGVPKDLFVIMKRYGTLSEGRGSTISLIPNMRHRSSQAMKKPMISAAEAMRRRSCVFTAVPPSRSVACRK
jgi:hypothetical protein